MQTNLFQGDQAPKEYKENLGRWADYFPFSFLPQFKTLLEFIAFERTKYPVYPDPVDVFRVFQTISPTDISVIILGQDPYFDGRANGYAFACKEWKTAGISPSLEQIINAAAKDLNRDFHKKRIVGTPELFTWVRQKVFLLNTALTVVAHTPGSHIDKWQPFIQQVFKILQSIDNDPIILLWGTKAKYWKNWCLTITKPEYILEYEHPASAARQNRNWGCKHFSRTNELLLEQGKKEIEWI